MVLDARYAGRRPSGIGRYTEALLRHLPGQVELTAWLHPRASDALLPNGRRVDIRTRANHLPTLWWPHRLGDLTGADVFHAPFNLLGRGIDVPTVVTLHDVMWVSAPHLCQGSRWRRAIQAPFFRAGIARALRHASRIITPSQASADAIAALHPQALSRLRVVPHGVDPAFTPSVDIDADARRCEALGVDGPFFLTVGQASPYKNHRAVVKAFEAADLSGTRLVVVERLGGRRRLDGRVTYLPGLHEDDLMALLRRARGLIQFSRDEGFGLPVLEAMACGTPVIVSDIPPLRELIGRAGVHVPLRLGALAAALRNISVDADWRADLARLGPLRAARFRWDDAIAAHLDVYAEAAGRRLETRRRRPRLAPRAPMSSSPEPGGPAGGP